MPASAVIIAPPGPLRDGLHALVGAMPQIDRVWAVGDVSAVPVTGSDPGPTLVVLDGDQAGEKVRRMVRRARVRWPQARTIVLVGTAAQHQEAELAGADGVLFQGLPAGRLVAAIVKLLPQPVM